MEGIIAWVGIIIAWVVIKSIFSAAFSGGGSESELDRQEIFDKLRLQLKVTEEIPPKERGLPAEKHLSVKVKGLIGHPTDSQTKVFLTIHDNTDLSDDDFGAPVLSAHPSFAEKNNRVFSLSATFIQLVPTHIFQIGLILFISLKIYYFLHIKEKGNLNLIILHVM